VETIAFHKWCLQEIRVCGCLKSADRQSCPGIPALGDSAFGEGGGAHSGVPAIGLSAVPVFGGRRTGQRSGPRPRPSGSSRSALRALGSPALGVQALGPSLSAPSIENGHAWASSQQTGGRPPKLTEDDLGIAGTCSPTPNITVADVADVSAYRLQRCIDTCLPRAQRFGGLTKSAG
jgi:hypothetical protein